MNRVTFVLALGLLLMGMFSMAVDTTALAFGLLGLAGCLAFLALQAARGRQQLTELGRLRNAHEQLDQQAKLIIRTDLELHQAQEELDRRLASLMALHQLGQQLQVGLRPEEVYTKLDGATVARCGFSRGLLGLARTFETLEWRVVIGIGADEAEAARTLLVETGWLKDVLSQSAVRVLESATADPRAQRLLEQLGVTRAVVSGVLPHTGPPGCLILGRTGGVRDADVDAELAGVLTNQLVAAVENSALFEETWSAKGDLERKVRERTHELADANARLQQVNKAKSDFVSAVSHELRTPLPPVRGYASLLNPGQFGELAPAQRERLAKIERHVDTLTQLINNLLDIARIESGRMTMEHQPIPVDELLAGAHDAVRPQLDAKRLRYQVDRDGVTQLMGDAQQLQRVLANLLSNAIKYTPDGGEIRVGLQRAGPRVTMRATDTGGGISSAAVPKLFQGFFRSADPVNQQVRGTGLGLALVKRIVEAHHGTVMVESSPGHGSTFAFTLPAA